MRDLDQAVNTPLSPSESSNNSDHKKMARNCTLKEMTTPNLRQQPLCIQYPQKEDAFELKSSMIHLLSSFHDLLGKGPNKHLKKFHMDCSIMKPSGITEEQVKLKAILFSLANNAKDWLYYLSSRFINTWEEMKKMLLEKYFLASKATIIRKEICGIRQFNEESLYEYWKQFKNLCTSCPHHQISEQFLLQYYYEGLMSMERNMIDAECEEALVDKTPEAARALILNMAANSQQFSTHSEAPRKVNEVNTSSNLDQKISDLTAIVKQLAINQVTTCGVCTTIGYPFDLYPTLQNSNFEQANAMGGFHPNNGYVRN